jgi:hypothetical protein
MVAAKAELNGIAEWSAADNLDLCAVTKPHFQQPAAKVMITADRYHAPLAADAQLVQTARIEGSVMIAGVDTAGLLHNYNSV